MFCDVEALQLGLLADAQDAEFLQREEDRRTRAERPDCGNARAEELGQNSKFRESFDTVTSRAVGRLNLIAELCLPLVKVGGKFLAMKSLSTSEELSEAKNAIELLGGRVEEIKEYSLTNGQETIERTIVVIRKVKPTPKAYPRNNSQISKKPL